MYQSIYLALTIDLSHTCSVICFSKNILFDIIIKCEGVRISESFSRGEQKLAVIALKLAQIIYLHKLSQKSPVILIDDMAAELDIIHREVLMDTIRKLNSQVFITSPDISLVETTAWKEKKLFHVEQGRVKEVV